MKNDIIKNRYYNYYEEKEGGQKMYKNYIFDLYGTLVDINTNETKKILWDKMQELYAFYGAEYTSKELKKEYNRICREEEAKIKKFDYPEMKIERVFKRLFEQKGVKMDTKSIVLVAQFFRITSTKYVRLYDETISVLEELKAKGKKIYLLSNAQNAFTAYEMKYLGIYDYFDGIKISSNESVRKPSLMFYDSLFEQYGLKKEESVMIGNDWISDMKSANDYGIDSIYIHTDISPRDTIIEEIRATYKILDGNIGNVKKYIR